MLSHEMSIVIYYTLALSASPSGFLAESSGNICELFSVNIHYEHGDDYGILMIQLSLPSRRCLRSASTLSGYDRSIAGEHSISVLCEQMNAAGGDLELFPSTDITGLHK